jgi:glutamine synthetase
MMVLNTIVAEQLNDFHEKVNALIEAGKEKRLAIISVLQDYIRESKAIRFEGDGYSDEWVEEAEKRGLSNVKTTPHALDFFVNQKAEDLFVKNRVMNKIEMQARHEIMLENYLMKVQIESRMMADLAHNHIIPTAINYQNKLIENANGLKNLGVDASEIVTTIEEISKHISNARRLAFEMIEERKRVNKIENLREMAIEYCESIKDKYFDPLRYAVDKLELYVDDEDWPLVKYRELLFLR